MTIHLADKFADMISHVGRGTDDLQWTACGLVQDRDSGTMLITTDPSLADCGNCDRTGAAARNAVVKKAGIEL